MGTRKVISTSLDAYKSLDPAKVNLMYKKIHQALEDLGPCTYEQIATYWEEKPERIWKRMNEAAKLGLCHRTEERRVMASGRQGFVWAVGGTPEPVKKRERALKGKAVVDYSRALTQVQMSLNSVEKLF
jgi:hypothetical protein